MPNYEYQCTECNHRFEIWQEVGAAAPACPECGSVVKKIFHVPRVHFKGSGFYVTDLRAEKGGNKSKDKDETATTTEPSGSTNGAAAENKTETADSSESKADTKAGTKPETKSESKANSKTDTKPTPAPAASNDKK